MISRSSDHPDEKINKSKIEYEMKGKEAVNSAFRR